MEEKITSGWKKVGTARQYVVWSRLEDGQEIYNVTGGEPPQPTDGGYPVLESLLGLKGITSQEFKST